jgi:hypothetical protein
MESNQFVEPKVKKTTNMKEYKKQYYQLHKDDFIQRSRQRKEELKSKDLDLYKLKAKLSNQKYYNNKKLKNSIE